MPAPPLESLPAMVSAVGRIGHHDGQLRDAARRRFAEDEQELKRRNGLARLQAAGRPLGGADDRLRVRRDLRRRARARRRPAGSRRRRGAPAA